MKWLREGESWMGNRCVSVRDAIGVTVRCAIANGKVIGSTLKVPLTMICSSDGYS